MDAIERTVCSCYVELQRTSWGPRSDGDPPKAAEAVIVGWNCRRRNMASSERFFKLCTRGVLDE